MVLGLVRFVLDEVVTRLIGHRSWVVSIALGLLIAYQFQQTTNHRKDHANRMEVDRCVELHNEIVRLGWEGLGRDASSRPPATWFEFYGAEAETVRGSLSDDVKAFLEQAHQVGEGQSLFYYVGALSHPSLIFDFNELAFLEASPTRYVLLYIANNIAAHPMGLVFDQVTNTAIMCVAILDSGIILNGRITWYPLETILEAWLDMIHKGKIKVLPEESEYPPWIVAPSSNSMFQETVQVFNQLVEAIESRLPGAGIQDENEEASLVNNAKLEDVPIRTGFAIDFVRSSRRPRFRYIAPGLEVPTDDTITDQPFFPPRNVEPKRDEIPPFLLFRSSEQYSHPSRSNKNHPFSWPYSVTSSFPAGLYFSSILLQDGNRWDDQCLLVLPFGIGANGFARMSDGTRFGEDPEDEDVRPKNTFVDLYQTGHQPFLEMHKVRLVDVLKSWLGMVERGDWEVDQNGIVGGIEKWRDADTESGWEKYLVPIGW